MHLAHTRTRGRTVSRAYRRHLHIRRVEANVISEQQRSMAITFTCQVHKSESVPGIIQLNRHKLRIRRL